jgi:hypothetical protein
MRVIVGVAVVLLASMAFAAATVDWLDISDAGGVNDGDTVFPSLSNASTLIFDNSAVLPFSTAPYASGNAWVNFPLTNSNVTIHSLAMSFDTSEPDNNAMCANGQHFAIGDQPNAYYTNTQGSPDDPGASAYFPYNIPRPQRDCAYDFTALYFQFARPATSFGVYLPCGSNNWDVANPITGDDNYRLVDSKWTNVFILRAGDTFLTAERHQLTLNGYCPYVYVDDPAGIMGVVITDNCFVNAGPTFGFMDPSATFLPHPGDANNDGAVDVVDLGILATNYDGDPRTWAQGNFNSDTVVDVVDLGILATNYDWVGAPAGVPEPATMAMLAFGGVAALIRRRK